MNWDDPGWMKESFEIFTQLAYEDWKRQWTEEKTMATREERGKALYDAVNASVSGTGRSLLAWESCCVSELYLEAAEKFAAWLREREKLESIFTEEKRRQLWEKFRAYEPGRSMLCPKGHVLTHPVDIQKRFCGTCREYLP